MTRLEQIETSITELDDRELAALSEWLEELRAARWDRQIAEDEAAGKLDTLAERARAEFRAGKTRPL